MNLLLNPNPTEFMKLAKRPSLEHVNLQRIVTDIYSEIEDKGDQAVKEFTKKYDQVELQNLRVDLDLLNEAYAQMDEKLKTAVSSASKNIHSFHSSQLTEINNLEVQKDIVLSQKNVGIQRIGIYIPGGTAPLLSTILMLAIPATIAGCQEIVLCSPPSYNGTIHPSILATAKMCGINEVYACGGAQAIAAMALGTESIKKVMKVFGPGNQYVTAAKEYALRYGVAMDLPAGPSELLVFADKTAVPAFVAADLLSQAEHGADSQVVLLSNSMDIISKVYEELANQIQSLPRRDIAEAALKNSKSIYFESTNLAFEFVNEYAPEHLIIACEEPQQYVEYIKNAGSVFLGNYCPESAGDYASGTNHTLPTNGWAKSFSGVNIDAFTKKISFQAINKEGLESLALTVTTMAREEQLEAHARAIDIRLKK